MRSSYANWRDYQEAVASHFRSRGCAVHVERKIAGARATHTVDVFVTFRQHGVECRWAIECKLWKRSVEKAQVLAFKSIVEDIGADRGLIFTESDYQSGARDAARNTNILLVSSLDDFKCTVELGETRKSLALHLSDEPGAPPVYAFPNGDQPHHLVAYRNRVFAGNWKTGSIAVIDPTTKSIESMIDLDKYEKVNPQDGRRRIHQHVPGRMACADDKLFVGQVFSDFVLAIDIETQSIVRRIALPGGGEGAIAASNDGEFVYFASNRVHALFIINSATYEFEHIPFPAGGRGSLCVLPHPRKPIVYVGIQRGGWINGRSYSGGNCFLATYDVSERRYVGSLYLAEIHGGRSDDAIPISLTYDEDESCLFIGMFQSRRGICRVDESGSTIQENFRFQPNHHNTMFEWVDPLSQALYRDRLLSVNRNNYELVFLDKQTGAVERSVFLGTAPNGPKSIIVSGNVAVISYPAREGLIFCDLDTLGR